MAGGEGGLWKDQGFHGRNPLRFMPSPVIRTILVAVSAGLTLPLTASASAEMAFFEKHIRPLLAERCYECHSEEAGKSKGGLLLDTREGWRVGGDSGAAIKPGAPDDSLLIEAVRYHNQDMQMPPKGALKKSEIALLEQWVAMGAPDPRAGAAKSVEVKPASSAVKHWAFQPMAEVEPQIRNSKFEIRNPIDAFLNEAMAAKNIEPAPTAGRGELLRRVTYDLTGLPPTPEEMRAFLDDPRPDAYERVIERLLASPRYGERWGRHWLDVARYADSNGLDENVAFGSAWRYRDYVVRAFNNDKPFDQFLTEQIAGDLMVSPDLATRLERVTATAFLNLGAKVLAEPDKEKLVMDIVDEQIDTVGKTFLGMTLGCVRCHDHKFDPLPQTDYYALAAIFKSTRSLSKDRTGAISYWTEAPLAGLDAFAEAHAAERALTEAKKKLSTAEAAAKKAIEEQARAQALEYLEAALELPSSATLTQAAAIAQPRGLHGAILLNCRVYLHTKMDDAFFDVWRAAAESKEAALMRAHFAPLFEAAQAAAAKDEPAAVTEARQRLQARAGFLALPPVADPLYPAETLAEIHRLRDEADRVEKSLPDLPAVMAVADAETILKDLQLHIRGNHLALGDPVPRGVPGVMQVAMRKPAPAFPQEQSGRLELAQWLTDPEHPLTARVLVNRIWTWHFGRGLVATPDNFGVLGAAPSHPELLDWLARRFIREGWSVKAMHRWILTSAAYRRAAAATGPPGDLENTLLSRFPVRRLEAEEIRDTVLAVAGLLDLTEGGKTVPLRNRQFVFNHTSKDATGYDSPRRALYLPVIRNHLYELFQQFDYPDPSMPTGLRNSSVVAPQALLMLNSELLSRAAEALAARFDTEDASLAALYETLYNRPPQPRDLDRCRDFVRTYDAALMSRIEDATERQRQTRAALFHTLLMANELIYLR